MVHDVIMEKFDEYNEHISRDAAMVCAVLDVRLLGLMNCLPEESNVLNVSIEELKKSGVIDA